MKALARANSLFTQLLLAFLVPIIIIEGFSIAFFSRGKAAINGEIISSAQANINYMINEFDARINNATAQLNQLLYGNSSMVRAFLIKAESSARDARFYLNALELAQRLTDVKNSVGIAERIIVSFDSIDFEITSENDGHALDAADYEAQLEAFFKSAGGVYAYDKSLRLGYAYPISAYQTRRPLIFAGLEISRDAISEIISTHGAYQDYHTLLFNPESGHVICEDGDAFEAAVIDDYLNMGVLKARGDWVAIYASSHYNGYIIAQYLPYNTLFGAAANYQRSFNIFIALSCAALIGYCFIIYRLNIKPIRALSNAFLSMREGNIGGEIALGTSNEFAELIDGFNQTSRRLKSLIEKLARQEVYAHEIEFKQLQAQISPHFLYNSFFTLKHMISGNDTQSASLLAEHLGEYFQYITRNAEQSVKLYSEYMHAGHYLEIQKLRFAGRLEAKMDELPPEARDIIVPRLILQPLIENAFAHGLKNMRKGRLEIDVERHENAVVIGVNDNGDALTDAALEAINAALGERAGGETTGLININLRLKLRFGEEYGLQARRSRLGGLEIRLILPSQTPSAVKEAATDAHI